jgi:hypothetical protein
VVGMEALPHDAVAQSHIDLVEEREVVLECWEYWEVQEQLFVEL